MKTKNTSSHVSAPNVTSGLIADEQLLKGFLLAMGASGRKPKTLIVYEESIGKLSAFGKGMGFPPLVAMTPEHVRHWLMCLHQRGNKPATVSVRYRAVNRFFGWCVKEGERQDNPLDRIDPPTIPDEIQPFYDPIDIEAVLKHIGRETPRNFRDAAIILTLFDSGVRAAELCGMRESDLNWREQTILVTGKGGKQRRVSLGYKAAQAIERYLRKRGVKSQWLWLAKGNNKPLAPNGLRMMLERRFADAGVKFRGAHGFRRGFAMSYLASGGQEGDLKELGGWENYAMVSRYAKANAGERAVAAHKKLSPGDRLNVR